jgi:hypothetical protein
MPGVASMTNFHFASSMPLGFSKGREISTIPKTFKGAAPIDVSKNGFSFVAKPPAFLPPVSFTLAHHCAIVWGAEFLRLGIFRK